jgi:hypothetical protein
MHNDSAALSDMRAFHAEESTIKCDETFEQMPD